MSDFSFEGLSSLLKHSLGEENYSRQVHSALKLAYHGHQGQFREQSNPSDRPIPYIVHPVGVAVVASELYEFVKLSDDFQTIISSCLTHDLLEDTNVTRYELEKKTSERTLNLVIALTKPSSANFTSREDRNLAFLEAIKKAGKSAIFIKLCDHMHNLSRPKNTPLELLMKIFEKGHDQYLELLEFGNLGNEFHASYEAKLAEVEKFVSTAQVESVEKTNNKNIEEAFKYCAARTKQKVLEPHDVIEILADVTGAIEVLFLSISDFKKKLTEELINIETHDLSIDINKISEGGEIFINKSSVKFLSSHESAIKIISIAPKAIIESGKQIWLIVGSESPSWVTWSIVSTLVSSLFERAIFYEAARINDISDLIRTNKLLAQENMTEEEQIKLLIPKGESKTLEFKETFSFDVKKGTKEKYLEQSVLKTIGAFFNTLGGDLLIGVNDDKEIVGVDEEIGKFYKNGDKYLLSLKNQIKSKVGEGFYPLIDYKLIEIEGKHILRVNCGMATTPCFLDDTDFYVRGGPSTDKLEGRQQHEYIKERF